ncbi:MAG: Hpt domain-containing protein [Saprospiraceae bacterium]|nr:Hpt domain-containing protein [Saprospiraceae bacterium]MBP7679806.1 Hpt domain-containing protein [Saprospiraceae bacterium]
MTTNTETFQYINLSYLQMMSGDDIEMQYTVLMMLEEEIPQELEKMQTALTAKDWQALGNISHKMKSTLAFIGNETMISANAHIEKIARFQASKEGIEEFLIILDAQWLKVLPELQTATKQHAPPQ